MLNRAEMFVNFIYSPDISYEKLLLVEERLQNDLTSFFTELGGSFIQFSSLADTMRVQCTLDDFTEPLFHTICTEVSGLLPKEIESKILFVDKKLEKVAIYFVRHDAWEESIIRIPSVGPIERALRKEALKK